MSTTAAILIVLIASLTVAGYLLQGYRKRVRPLSTTKVLRRLGDDPDYPTGVG